jgi:AraC family transcriptional regulator
VRFVIPLTRSVASTELVLAITCPAFAHLRDERIEQLVRALESNLYSSIPAGPVFAHRIGIALAARLLNSKDVATVLISRLSETQLKRVLDYIDAQIEGPITIDALCRVAGTSNSHLRTWFKAFAGVTLHRYLLYRRVEHARALLQGTELSLSEVAHRSGFAHQSHLIR